jgi:hypothetical protein
MIRARKHCKIRARAAWPRRVWPCQVPDSMYPTPPRGLPTPKISRRQRLCAAVATSPISRARHAASRAFAIGPVPACCMTWATWSRGSRVISSWFIGNTAAPRATSSLTPIPQNIVCPKPATPTAWGPWPSVWLWKMACRIKRPVGICGGITGYLFPSRPSKTGWRPGGEKGGAANVDELSRLGARGLLRVHRGR